VTRSTRLRPTVGAATRDAESGLSGWEEFGIVVGGSIAAAAILGIAHWLWRKSQAPLLKIECGDSYDFDKRVGNTDVAVAPAVEQHRALAAFAKFVRVTETRGRSGASNVVLRMKDVQPPAPHSTAFVELRWADSRETNDIRPHGHKYAFAQLVIFYETKDGELGWRTTPTLLEHADTAQFTLELLVEGRRYSEERFRIVNPWSRSQIEAWPDDVWPPSEIEFPKIEKVTTLPGRT